MALLRSPKLSNEPLNSISDHRLNFQVEGFTTWKKVITLELKMVIRRDWTGFSDNFDSIRSIKKLPQRQNA